MSEAYYHSRSVEKDTTGLPVEIYNMKILSIETSCDETSASVVEKTKSGIKILSNITTSSANIHATTGGIIPEKAAREQLAYIIPVIIETLFSSQKKELSKNYQENYSEALRILETTIDAIAVTNGPGLIGSLLVGVETAKTLSFALKKPVVPIHHLLAHIGANFIGEKNIEFPLIGLVISGGHTDLLYFKSVTNFKWLGGTRDDAAGEALDKIGRLLNIDYPAGREIERRAKKVSRDGSSVKGSKFSFTSPLIGSSDFDFSFSGLKAEAARAVKKSNLSDETIDQICFATQKAMINVVVKKTIMAASKYGVKTILLGGGVSSNQTLKNQLDNQAQEIGVKVFSPDMEYCTDNAAMIGAQALLNYKPVEWHNIQTQPELYF